MLPCNVRLQHLNTDKSRNIQKPDNDDLPAKEIPSSRPQGADQNTGLEYENFTISQNIKYQMQHYGGKSHRTHVMVQRVKQPTVTT